MYSDYEVDCWYLGKPFPEEASETGCDLIEICPYTDEDIEKLFLGLPLLAA